MTEEYGLEDICVALDGIEQQLKRLFILHKRVFMKILSPSEIVEVEQI